ncbi:hypothetical protein [Microtetraspora malaysiensis]|uniref:hypothetical protein n=1 Tax=Microtetraspora malaysiensis TaxID=161358 RepID=UPI003D927ACD
MMLIVGCSSGVAGWVEHPSYDELAALVVEQARTIAALRAENKRLKARDWNGGWAGTQVTPRCRPQLTPSPGQRRLYRFRIHRGLLDLRF